MKLPNLLDINQFSKSVREITGSLALNQFERLQAICNQVDQQAQVVLRFGIESKLLFIQGRVQATVNLICQRCNAPMTLDLDFLLSLSPVTTETQAKGLPEQYEPIFLQDECINVAEMIEDELLLALPMIPKHEDECS